MHPEVEELRPKLKEILYDCAVEIRATKAALYLWDGSSRFELASEYGFRTAAREAVDHSDPIVDRCGRGRTPFFVNGLAVEPRFSEILYEASTDRLLAAPVHMKGQMVGFIDMRDKAGKQPFEQPDVPKAQRIADRIASLFANKNVFGLRLIQLAEHDDPATAQKAQPAPAPEQAPPPKPAPAPPAPPPVAPPAAPAPAPVAQAPVQSAAAVLAPPVPVAAVAQRAPAAAAAPARQRPEQVEEYVPPIAALIVEARKQAVRAAMPPTPEMLTDAELALVRDVLRSVLLIPGAVVATFSAFGHLGGVQEVVARAPLSEEATHFLHSKLNGWLSKRGEPTGPLRVNLQVSPGASGSPLGAAQMEKVFTAPVAVGTMRGLYLTVAFGETPDRNAHELLAAQLNHLQVAIENSVTRNALLATRMKIAEKLIEPDLAKYSELRHHTNKVVTLVDQFVRLLGISSRDAELVHIVAMVHDAGMRLLDYDRLYLKRDISSEELAILRDHVFVGAAIVEPLLGGEVARAVLCHHERVDGRGYPNEMRGDEIPLASRILQICDAYVAITDPHTYQPVEGHDDALEAILRGAGSQFDEGLAKRFVEMMRQVRATY